MKKKKNRITVMTSIQEDDQHNEIHLFIPQILININKGMEKEVEEMLIFITEIYLNENVVCL